MAPSQAGGGGGDGGERRREPTSVNATEAKRPLLARPRFVTLRAAATSDLLVGAPWQLLAQTAAGCGRALVSCRVADRFDPTDLHSGTPGHRRLPENRRLRCLVAEYID